MPSPSDAELYALLVISYRHVKTKEAVLAGSTGSETAVQRAGNRPRQRRQRADAKQSIAALLDAAIRVLGENPGATVADIAQAAGVSRQTAYAHFPSREALVTAVTRRATAEVTAALDAAGLDDAAPAKETLTKLLDEAWQVAARYPFLWRMPPASREEDAARHAPVMDRMLELIIRGQHDGSFDPTLPPAWLLTAVLALGRTAEEEVQAGRMTTEAASAAVHHSCLRLLGIDTGAVRS